MLYKLGSTEKINNLNQNLTEIFIKNINVFNFLNYLLLAQ